jgi:hypothetical protein
MNLMTQTLAALMPGVMNVKKLRNRLKQIRIRRIGLSIVIIKSCVWHAGMKLRN